MANGRRRLLAGLCGLGVLLGTGLASAAETPKPTPGITLSPFLQQLSIAPDDASRSFTLSVTNHTTAEQVVKLTARDFGSLDETGGVLLEGSKGYSQKYGLATWIHLETDTVSLKPKETRTVTITIGNETSLRPGGHYGAIVSSIDSVTAPSDNYIGINQQLLSLILLTKVGGEQYDLRLDRVSQNGNLLHLPNQISLHFKNPGNVHVIPRGLVKLTSPGGTVVAQGIINAESAYILPESARELLVPLNSVANALPVPGLYHLEVEYRYDGIDRVAHKQVTVKYLNLGLYLVLLMLLAGVGFVLYRRKMAPKKSSPAK